MLPFLDFNVASYLALVGAAVEGPIVFSFSSLTVLEENKVSHKETYRYVTGLSPRSEIK